MSTALDMSKDINIAREKAVLKQKRALYETELQRLFFEVSKQFVAYDTAFLEEATKEIDDMLQQMKKQLNASGVRAHVTSTYGTELVRSGQSIYTDESFKKCDRDKCILFLKWTGEPEKLVFNMTKQWKVTVSGPTGKTSMDIYAIMAFRHSTDVVECPDEDEENEVEFPQGLSRHSDPKVYTEFPRFVLYAAKEGDGDDLVPITTYLCLIQESVKTFVLHVFD